MIYIFYTYTPNKLKTETFNYILKLLPPDIENKILRFRKWQDAQRSLLGKALLLDGLQYLGLTQYSLADIKYTNLEKPFFNDSIDFNISHAGNYVICAISLTNKIGVDVEEIKIIPLDDFTSNFSDREWADILKNENDFYCFYKYWTQKEAFLKAIGMGLNVPLKDAEIINNKITWENTEWYLHEIKLDVGYISHLSTNIFLPQIIIEKREYN